MSNKKLKQCPFCNGKAEIESMLSGFYASCKECYTESRVFDTEAEVVEAWNKRHSDKSKPLNFMRPLEFDVFSTKFGLVKFSIIQKKSAEFETYLGYFWDGIHVATSPSLEIAKQIAFEIVRNLDCVAIRESFLPQKKEEQTNEQ